MSTLWVAAIINDLFFTALHHLLAKCTPVFLTWMSDPWYIFCKFSTVGAREPLGTQPHLEGLLLKLTNGDKGLGACSVTQ